MSGVDGQAAQGNMDDAEYNTLQVVSGNAPLPLNASATSEGIHAGLLFTTIVISSLAVVLANVWQAVITRILTKIGMNPAEGSIIKATIITAAVATVIYYISKYQLQFKRTPQASTTGTKK